MKRTSKRSAVASKPRRPAGKNENSVPAIINHARVEKALLAVKRALDEAGVDFIVLKGPQLAGLYDNPYERLMSDLDILVREVDFHRAGARLERAGFSFKDRDATHSISGKDYNTSLFGLGGAVWVELHRDIAPHWRYNADIKGMFERSITFKFGSVKVRGLSVDDLLLSMCIHIAKDYFAGVEKKHFVDVAVVTCKEKVDWDAFLLRVKQAGAASASYYILLAAARQFGAVVPEDVLTALKPSILRRIWLGHYLDPCAYPVYRFPEHKGLGIQLRMALPLMDGVLRGQGVLLRYAFLRAGDVASSLKTNPLGGGND
jgi:hypothetical protein